MKVQTLWKDTNRERAFRELINDYKPVVVQERIEGFESTWRCFQCNAIFTNEKEAAEHFGEKETPRPFPLCCCI